jgi:tungstate transport system permease protein
MSYLVDVVGEACRLVAGGDPNTYQAIGVTLKVSLVATGVATVIGVPIGLIIGIADYRGKSLLFLLLNTLLSMPTVVVGLTVYLVLCRQGPLGELRLMFTPAAMVIGEVLLILPLIVAFSATAVASIPLEVKETAIGLGASWSQMAWTVLDEARFAVLAAVIAGFGRAISEVGAALMLGGNIRGVTRTMTTAIALETSKGEFALGLALGAVLMFLAFAVNLLFNYFQQRARTVA